LSRPIYSKLYAKARQANGTRRDIKVLQLKIDGFQARPARPLVVLKYIFFMHPRRHNPGLCFVFKRMPGACGCIVCVCIRSMKIRCVREPI